MLGLRSSSRAAGQTRQVLGKALPWVIASLGALRSRRKRRSTTPRRHGFDRFQRSQLAGCRTRRRPRSTFSRMWQSRARCTSAVCWARWAPPRPRHSAGPQSIRRRADLGNKDLSRICPGSWPPQRVKKSPQVNFPAPHPSDKKFNVVAPAGSAIDAGSPRVAEALSPGQSTPVAELLPPSRMTSNSASFVCVAPPSCDLLSSDSVTSPIISLSKPTARLNHLETNFPVKCRRDGLTLQQLHCRLLPSSVAEQQAALAVIPSVSLH